jgi:Sigma-70, region 4
MSAALVILPMVWGTAAPAKSAEAVAEVREQRRTAPEVAFYRKYTEGLLRRYMRLSMESGRVPSLLGREMFRGNVTNYTVHGFDDVVIFVHDVERCLAMLDEGQKHLIRRIGLQEFTQEETASLLGLPLRSVHRRYADALDELTEIFLERKLLEPSKAGREAGTIL